MVSFLMYVGNTEREKEENVGGKEGERKGERREKGTEGRGNAPVWRSF